MEDNGRLRILYLIGTLELCGTGIHLYELVRRLDPRRFHVEVCCIRREGPLVQRLEELGIPVDDARMPTLYRPMFLPRLASLAGRIRRGRYDLVHGLLFMSDVFGTLAARVAGVRHIVNSRRMMPSDDAKRRQKAYRLANAWVDRIVAPSEAVRRACIENEAVAPERVVTIYNGIDPARVREAPPATDLPSGPGPWLLTAGGINPLKGHDTLVRALPSILAAVPDCRVAVAGDGPLRSAVIAEAERLGVRDAVHLLGVRSDVPGLLRWADLFVQPSDSEGMSNALLEALCAGRAAVATSVGGNPEVVREGETGLLVPPGDPEALAAACVALLRDPERRRAMGRRAMEDVDRRFTVDRMARDAAAFYESLITSGAGRARVGLPMAGG